MCGSQIRTWFEAVSSNLVTPAPDYFFRLQLPSDESSFTAELEAAPNASLCIHGVHRSVSVALRLTPLIRRHMTFGNRVQPVTAGSRVVVRHCGKVVELVHFFLFQLSVRLGCQALQYHQPCKARSARTPRAVTLSASLFVPIRRTRRSQRGPELRSFPAQTSLLPIGSDVLLRHLVEILQERLRVKVVESSRPESTHTFLE
jgi:hypothetical protein